VRFRIVWDHNNDERLRRMYSLVNPAKTAKEFYDTISLMFGEGLTSTAVRRRCQRLGLNPKVSDVAEPCTYCDSPAKIKGKCVKHYKAEYFQKYKTI